MVEVSAKTGQNRRTLDMIVLTAQVMDLKVNPDRQAKGTVIESIRSGTRTGSYYFSAKRNTQVQIQLLSDQQSEMSEL